MLPEAAKGLYDFLWTDENTALSESPGITLAGSMYRDESSAQPKFRSLPLEALEKIIPHFDYVFIEADGSKTLPLKAWAEWEPVITASTTVSIGVLPLNQLGMPVDSSFIHRLPLFLQLTGAKEGEKLNLTHISRVVSGWNGAKGLFGAAQGKKILFINQAEDKTSLQAAHDLAIILKETACPLDSIIAGSVKRNIWTSC